MRIEFIDIQNFRKLKATRIDFDPRTTIFVGANNSGKTSAMVALRYFLLDPQRLSLKDITIANWRLIDHFGAAWEAGTDIANDFSSLLPAMDIWLRATLSEIHHVVHILPTIDWAGGSIGVRLRYEFDDPDKLRADFLAERAAAKELATALGKYSGSQKARVWPASLTDYLGQRLSRHVKLRSYPLDPGALATAEAKPQALPADAIAFDASPFKKLIRIDDIVAQREFADAGERTINVGADGSGDESHRRYKRRLSEQLRSYYDRHLDPAKKPSAEDVEALGAIQTAERNFDDRLKQGFSAAFAELEELGYPGITNPRININTQLRATDGLKHGSAIEYVVADADEGATLRLPEDYSGLGYQNLISMVFMLMSFRDDWMRVGKASSVSSLDDDAIIPPLHLVLVEEPEAHLHAQVQQVFINKAYDLLRKHPSLGPSEIHTTQLVISTHSSHVAHEADFGCLRYFRRHRPKAKTDSPTTTVANLSALFGEADATTRFVKRYLKSTHCDLFFADGVIFVEGQAERMLIPLFIRHHFMALSRRYVTLLDMGGSHTHKFKPLIETLGIPTIIIADLDAGVLTEVTTSSGTKTTRIKSHAPKRGSNQKTSNPVLKSWHPAKDAVDDLLDLNAEDHVIKAGDDFAVYVAYQKEVTRQIAGGPDEILVPRTFEDALIFENEAKLATLAAESGPSGRIGRIVSEGLSGEDLSNELFDLLKSAEKAAFALDCLMYFDDPAGLSVPPYIRTGLEWFSSALDEKTSDAVLPEAVS